MSESIKVTTGDLRNQAKSISDVAMLVSEISAKNTHAINKINDACSFFRVGSINYSAKHLIQKFTDLLDTLTQGAQKAMECADAYESADNSLKSAFSDWFDDVEAGDANLSVMELISSDTIIPLDDYFSRVTDAEYAKLCGMWGYAAMEQDSIQAFLKKLEELPERDPLRNITANQIRIMKSGTGFSAISITDNNGNALVIFAGTNEDIGDYVADVKLFFTIEPEQERQAREFINSLRQTHSNIVVTGHSLGGYLATSAALQYGEISRCVAFDPPGRHDDLWQMLTNRDAWDKITTYEANGSVVSGVGRAMGDYRPLDVIENGGGITYNHDIDAISYALGGKDRIWLSWGQEYIPQGGW